MYESGFDAVDGSSTRTRVPRMRALLRLPRFRGATHADDHNNRHGVDAAGEVVILGLVRDPQPEFAMN